MGLRSSPSEVNTIRTILVNRGRMIYAVSPSYHRAGNLSRIRRLSAGLETVQSQRPRPFLRARPCRRLYDISPSSPDEVLAVVMPVAVFASAPPAEPAAEWHARILAAAMFRST